jgi:hypothetical protein
MTNLRWGYTNPNGAFFQFRLRQDIFARVYLHCYLIESVCLNACLVGSLAEPHYTGWRIVESWRLRVSWNGNADLVRYLSRHLVECQRGDQVDYSLRHFGGDSDEVGISER